MTCVSISIFYCKSNERYTGVIIHVSWWTVVLSVLIECSNYSSIMKLASDVFLCLQFDHQSEYIHQTWAVYSRWWFCQETIVEWRRKRTAKTTPCDEEPQFVHSHRHSLQGALRKRIAQDWLLKKQTPKLQCIIMTYMQKFIICIVTFLQYICKHVTCNDINQYSR